MRRQQNIKFEKSDLDLICGVIPAFDLSVLLGHCVNPFSDECPKLCNHRSVLSRPVPTTYWRNATHQKNGKPVCDSVQA